MPFKDVEEKRRWYRKYQREYYGKRRETLRLRKKLETETRHLERKRVALEHYSGGSVVCANPYGLHEKPFTDVRALSLDPIEFAPDKSRIMSSEELHRLLSNPTIPRVKPLFSKARDSYRFHLWLVKNGYPEGFHVLCQNCKAIKKADAEEGLRNKQREALKNMWF
ncbi:MAG: hypothetical protein ABSB26_05755 [Nitrososphaerales archaeon]|jgi:hypothetical protein